MQLSQNLGMSGGYRPYRSKRASRHSCSPSSVPFTVDGCTISHAPVFFTRRKQRERRATWTRAPVRVVPASASSDRLSFCFRAYYLPSLRNEAWYAVLNYSWPLSAATRCPAMIQDGVQFSGAVSVGSERARPTCFTGRRVTPRPGIPSPMP